MFVNTIFFLFWEKEVERNIFTVAIGFFTLYHDPIFISLEFVTDKSLLVRINHAFIFNKIDTGKNSALFPPALIYILYLMSTSYIMLRYFRTGIE